MSEVHTVQYSTVQDSKEKSNPVSVVFDHYVSKGIIQHKKLTGPMKTAINARLKDYDLEQILKAIDNYSEVLFGDRYYFSHKYPLADFMRDKDVRKFLDEADPLNNFLRNKGQKDSFQLVNGGKTYGDDQQSNGPEYEYGF